MQTAVITYLLTGFFLLLYRLFSTVGENLGFKMLLTALWVIVVFFIILPMLLFAPLRKHLLGPIWNPLNNRIRSEKYVIRLLFLTPVAYWGFSTRAGVPHMPFLENVLRHNIVELSCKPDLLLSVGQIIATVATLAIAAITVKGTRFHGQWTHLPTTVVLVSGVALLPVHFLMGGGCLLTYIWLSPKVGVVSRNAALAMDSFAVALAGYSISEWTKILFCLKDFWITTHPFTPAVVIFAVCCLWLGLERKSLQ